MKDKVLAVVRKEGAVLPVHVASQLGMDSLLASAYLQELVENGALQKSPRRVGTSFIFYAPGHEKKAKIMFKEATSHAQTVRTYSQAIPKNATPELLQKQKDFIEIAKKLQKQHTAPKSVSRPIPRPVQTIPRFVPQTPHSAPEIEVKPDFSLPETTFLDEGMEWLRMNDIEIVEEIARKKKQIELVVQTPSNFGKIKLFVSIKDKKSITENDISIAQSRAISRGLQAAIISNGKLSKSGEKFNVSEGNKVLIKQL